MKLDHPFTAPVTAVLTACNRADLLEHTLDSFFAFNTYPHVSKTIVVEDSAIAGVNDRLKTKYADRVTWLNNETPLGQIASIDRGYAIVDTPYIFHCEDDWEFFESGFIEASMTVLEADKHAICVWLRAHDDTNGHPIHPNLFAVAKLPSGDEVKFKFMQFDHHIWQGFTFNPGLRRLADYRDHFPAGFARHPGINPSNSAHAEAKISNIYKSLGFYAAILDVPSGFVRHTGFGRHVG